MTVATFIVSKHPFGPVEDGETRITRRLLDAAAAACRVRVVALTERGRRRPGTVEVVEVAKPAVSLPRLALAGAARRRSLIHARFAPASLVRVLSEEPAGVLVARRVYMAQAALDAGRGAPGDRLVALVDVLESSVMALRRSRWTPLLELEARRTRRDERRCVQAASEVAFLSDTEAVALHDIARGRRLDLALPPASRPATLEDPVAVFVGDRRWAPNAHAFERLLALWPRIARGVPRARLLVVGHPAGRERPLSEAGVERLGFVEDLEALWREVAVLLAPVSIGGGVRVKVLDAARHGVPVVGSQSAIGATQDYLPVAPSRSDDEFVADSVALLGDAAHRRRRGQTLFEANRALDERGFVEEQVADLLIGSRIPGARTPAAT